MYVLRLLVINVGQCRHWKEQANIYKTWNIFFLSKKLNTRCFVFKGHFRIYNGPLPKAHFFFSIKFKQNEWKSLNLLISLNFPNSICIPIFPGYIRSVLLSQPHIWLLVIFFSSFISILYFCCSIWMVLSLEFSSVKFYVRHKILE